MYSFSMRITERGRKCSKSRAKKPLKFDIHLVILATVEDAALARLLLLLLLLLCVCQCVNTTSKPQLLSRRASGKVWHNNCDNYRKELKRAEKENKQRTQHSGQRKRCQRQEKCRRFGCRLSPILAHQHTQQEEPARRGRGGGVGGKATTWPGIKITFPRTVKYYEFLHFRNSFLSAFPSSVTPQ